MYIIKYICIRMSSQTGYVADFDINVWIRFISACHLKQDTADIDIPLWKVDIRMSS